MRLRSRAMNYELVCGRKWVGQKLSWNESLGSQILNAMED